MKRTTFYLVRHGKTIGSEETRYKGHTDVDLSREGEEEIRILGERLAHLKGKISAVYSSDLSRAFKTAEILSHFIGVRPRPLMDLRERSFGRWEGLSFREIETAYPVEFSRWKTDPLRYSPPGGESTEEVALRVMRALEAIIGQHKGERVLVVAHGGVNRVILCHFMGLPLENIFRIEQDFGCLNIIDIYEDSWPVVRLLNCNLIDLGGHYD